jgi:ribokinase
VAVVGSSNTDLVIRCSHLPVAGETVGDGVFAMFGGGKGANQAVAAARAGASVHFVGARGRDAFGSAAARALRQEGIDTRFFRLKPGVASGVALILVGGEARENMIAVAASANSCLTADDVQSAASVIGRSRVVVTQLEIPMAAVLAAAEAAVGAGVPLVLNPAPGGPIPDAVLKRTFVITPNRGEARQLTGAATLEGAARSLVRQGCRHVVITLGAAGAYVYSAGTASGTRIRAPRVTPVDTVGAGDCLTAWVAVGIAEGLSLVAAVRRAVQAAAIAVTRHGAQSGMPFRREVVVAAT